MRSKKASIAGAELRFEVVNLHEGSLPLIPAAKAPEHGAWVPHWFKDEDVDELVWSFLKPSHKFRKRATASVEIERRDGWLLQRDVESGIPLGLTIQDVAARGYNWMQVGTRILHGKFDARGQREVRLLVLIIASKEGALECSAIDFPWKEADDDDALVPSDIYHERVWNPSEVESSTDTERFVGA